MPDASQIVDFEVFTVRESAMSSDRMGWVRVPGFRSSPVGETWISFAWSGVASRVIKAAVSRSVRNIGHPSRWKSIAGVMCRAMLLVDSIHGVVLSCDDADDQALR